MARTWQVRGSLTPVTSGTALRHYLLSRLGVESGDRERFFSPVYERDIFDPLAELYGAAEAVERIYRAIGVGERILVWGDYDADGIASTAILLTVLEELGAAAVPFLPHREEQGYGLHQATLELMVGEIDLVITCDCGVANREEIDWLAKQGVDSIVLDHHSVPAQLPEAVAIVHPQHPRKTYVGGPLCGAGVSWKVAAALLRDRRSPYRVDLDREKWLLDLAVIGTVADMVPLKGENRTIVQFGLEVLRRTRRPGLDALLKYLKLERGSLSADDIAWRIAPRLNAAGRMDHAQPALDLLLTQNLHRAEELMLRLENLNRLRQTASARILKEVEGLVADEPVIFAFNNSWRAGVVGLAAGRLAEKYQRPAVVVGSNGQHAVGSARSPAAVNVLQLLEQGRTWLYKLGGHAQAAGFSLAWESVPGFRRAVQTGRETQKPSLVASAVIDAVVDPSLLTPGTVALLDEFAPFGEGNPRPAVLVRGISQVHWRAVGKAGEHAKFVWERQGERLEGIGFGLAKAVSNFSQAMVVDVVGTLETNEWRGRRALQLAVRDIAPAGSVELVSSE